MSFIFQIVSFPIYKKSKQRNCSNTSAGGTLPNKNEQLWYIDESQEKKYCFLHMQGKYRELKTDENRINMVRARSKYKLLLRKCRYEYDREKTNKFVNAKNKNAKSYWNMIKELSHVKSADILLSSFEAYFKSVNNPLDPFITPDEDVIHLMRDM